MKSTTSLPPLLLLLLLLCTISTLPGPSSAEADGVFEDLSSGSVPGGYPSSSSSSGGAPGAYGGGATTEEAFASDLAVPQPQGGAVQSVGYYRQLADWFESWLNHNGVDTSKLEITIEESTNPQKRPNIKLHASRDMASGEELFRLPPSVQASSRNILHDHHPLYKDASTLDPLGWADYTALAAWVLRERAVDTASPWAPYLRMLPPYVSLPIFFPDDLVMELQFEAVIADVLGHKQAIKEEYEACVPSALNNATLEEFSWAMAIGMSRAFSGPADPRAEEKPGHSAAVLLPVADLMDHSNQYNVESRFDNELAFIFYVNKDLAKGDELLNQYGLKDTDTLLISYGFVLDPNDQDRLQLADRNTGARDLYRTHFATENSAFGESEDEWALYVSGRADSVAVEKALAEKSELGYLFGPKFELGYPDALNAWHGGIVDPPLLASLAATIYYFSFGKEPDYEKLARLSVWYGWYLYSSACSELGEHLSLDQNEIQSFISAASGVRTLVEGMLEKLPTSVEEDENIMAAIAACEAGGNPIESNPEMKTYCESLSEGDASTLEQHKLVVHARLVKKRLLRDLSVRLETTCHAGLPPPPVGSSGRGDEIKPRAPPLVHAPLVEVPLVEAPFLETSPGTAS